MNVLENYIYFVLYNYNNFTHKMYYTIDKSQNTVFKADGLAPENDLLMKCAISVCICLQSC